MLPLETKRMRPSSAVNPFSRLREVTIHPLLACNLGCSYCYQDAARTTQPVAINQRGTEWAQRLDEVLSRSEMQDIDVVVTGGEPLLLGHEWFEEFFAACAATIQSKGKRLTFVIQTNASIPVEGKLLELCKQHAVRFSVHYDGLIPGPDLQSQRRREVIGRLGEESLPLTAIIVGTSPALEVLADTLDFFRQCGVSHYRLNPVGGEGRGGRAELNPPPRQRAEAEFLTGYHAWQNQYGPFESGIIWKFVAFCRTELGHRPRATAVSPQPCGGGESSLTIYPDGSVYPCGFFCDLTGPSFNLSDLDCLDAEMAGRLNQACRRRSVAFEQRCPSCDALIFCEAYCAMAAIRDNHEILCQAQRELFGLMRDQLPLTVAIANSFLAFQSRVSGSGSG